MGYAAELVGVIDGTSVPPKKSDGTVVGSQKSFYRATIDLSRADIDKTLNGFNVLFRKPKGGAVPIFRVYSSVSLTTSQLQFGIAGDATKYAAPKVYGTVPEAEVVYSKVSALAAPAGTAVEDIRMTNIAAALPGAGIIVVIMELQDRN